MDEFKKKYDLKEGIFDGVSDHEYHYGKYRKLLSNSGFKELARSALHYKTWRDRPPPEPNSREKDFFVFGKAYHVWMLERSTFFKRFHIVDKMTRSARDGKPTGKWADVVAEAGDKQILWREDLVTIQEMADAIKLNRTAEAIVLNPGVYERTYVWKNEYGIWCKCRTDIDIEDLNVIGDLKSAVDASWENFGKKAFNLNYHVQAAWYVHGVSTLTGKPKTFIFLAQEKDPPYASTVHRVEQDIVMSAWDRIDPLLQRLAKAFREGEYKAYNDNLLDLFRPAWAY